MVNIAVLAGVSTPLAIAAYIDSVELFFRYLTRSQRVKLRRLGHLEECRDRHGWLWGYRLSKNQPSRRALLQLDRVAKTYRGSLCRFDLAVEFQPALMQPILRQVLLRWKSRLPMQDLGATTYWVWWGEKERPSKNLVLYLATHSKITGEAPCVRFELRFLRADAIRRAGIRTGDLIGINPNALFAKYVKWTSPPDKFVQRIVRKTVTADRERYCGLETSAFVDRYRAAIPRRATSLLRRLGYDRAQGVKDLHSKRYFKPIPAPVSVPEHLSWRKSLFSNHGLSPHAF
jgi:hypothetical protein